MTLTWTFEGRTLSSDDRFISGDGALDALQLPLMFKIGKVGGKDQYGYFDYERIIRSGLSPNKLAYAMKKCSYGINMVQAEHTQGIVKGDSGGLKVKLILLGDDRIASYTIWSDVKNNRELVVFNKIFVHDSKDEKIFYGKKSLLRTHIAQGTGGEDEAKDDGSSGTIPAGLSTEGFIKYTLTDNSALLELVLRDSELYKHMFYGDLYKGTASLLLESLLSMFLHDQTYAKVGMAGVTRDKWDYFFSLALEQTTPEEIELIRAGSNFKLLEHLVRINDESVLRILNNNERWRKSFWYQIELQSSNPLELFFGATKINADLFKLIVDRNPLWLLGQAAGSANYFIRLASYLEDEANRDNTLQAVIQTNLRLLPPEELEVLTAHLAGKRPFSLQYCRDYLGLNLGFTNLFSAKTNQEVIIPLIKEAKAPADIIALFHFFKPCLRPKGKGSVLEHLIGTGGINDFDQTVVLELFNEMPDDVLIERFNQYLDNGGNNWLIYNKFLDNFTGDLAPHATRLLWKLTILEGVNINHYNQEAVWGLFSAVQGGVFLENFERYLDRGGNDWRVYNKFLDEFKGDLSHYTPRLFLRLIDLGEEKLFKKFTSIGVDLTQTIEELKSGRLKLPDMTTASSAKLESLSRISKIGHALTTENILFLMEKSDKEIVDFCLTEGNEDLKVAILRVYQDSLPRRKQDSFSKALRIDPELTAKDKIFLTKATDSQIIDFCNKSSRIDILLEYKGRLSNAKLSSQEILPLLRYEEAITVFRNQIIELGHKVLFEGLRDVQNPVDIAFNLLCKNYKITDHDLEVLVQYPWSRQFAKSFILYLDKKLEGNVNFHIDKGPNGERFLAFEVIDSSAQQSGRNAEQAIPQINGIFNGGMLGNIIKGANIADLSINSVSRVIKFREEPNLADGSGLVANLLLLFRAVRPNHGIFRFAVSEIIMLYVVSVKAIVDVVNHGFLTSIMGLLSNFGQLIKLQLWPNMGNAVNVVASVVSLTKSVIELINLRPSYEQCEVLLFLELNDNTGSIRALIDNLDHLKVLGYSVVVIHGQSGQDINAARNHFISSRDRFISEYRNAQIMYKNDTYVADEYKAISEVFQAHLDLLSSGVDIYRIGVPDIELEQHSREDESKFLTTEVKKLCSKLGYRKQIFLTSVIDGHRIQRALKEENVIVHTFSVWNRKGACDKSFKNYPLLDSMSETLEEENNLKCQIRASNPSFSAEGKINLAEVANRFGLADVIILDAYSQLNSKAIRSAILNRIDPSTNSSNLRSYFEMTPNELQAAAMRGNEELQYNLGHQFVKYDKLHLAVQWYRRAAEGGKVEAKVRLAELLSAKPDLSTDPNGGIKEARKWAEEAVNEGSIEANWVLGIALEYDDGDILGAEKLYRKAAEAGHEEAKKSLKEVMDKIIKNMKAQHDFGVVAKKEGKLDEAESWFRKSAEQGFGRSQYELAALLFKKKNYVEAKIWAQKASDNDIPEGHFLLGSLLTYEDNFVSAKTLLLLSEEKGYEHAQGMLSIVNQRISEMVIAGLDSEDSKGVAILQSASGGSKQAQHDLADRLLQENKTKEAEYWYKEAAKQEFPPSQAKLAILLIERGNIAEAKELVHKSAKHGFIEAQETLGIMLEKEGDLDGAAEWYGKAKEQGSKNAPLMLAEVQLKIALREKSQEQKSPFVKFDSGKDLADFFVNSLAKPPNEDNGQVKLIEGSQNEIYIAGQDATPYEDG